MKRKLFVLIATLLPTLSLAQLNDAEYQRALEIASKKVARKNALKAQSSGNADTSSALSSSTVRARFGRMYRVGDNWDVAAISFTQTHARMTSDPSQLRSDRGKVAVFHYEVTEVKEGATPKVIIRVTQRDEFNVKKADARVQSLQLTLDDALLQNNKTYFISDSAGVVRTIPVSPDGSIRSNITELELFPLDVPELGTAENRPTESLPKLPPALGNVATRAGYAPSTARSLWYEQDDFFGRPVQVMWQQGDPWPTYLKTENGVSILIRKGAA